MKADITYAPEFVGEDTRLIAEREFLKLQVVLSQLAESIAQLSTRIERVASIADATNAEQNSRLDDIEDGLNARLDDIEDRLEALENPE